MQLCSAVAAHWEYQVAAAVKKGEKYPHTKASCQECAAASLPMALTLTLQTLFFFLSNHNGPHLSTLFSRKKQEEIFIY